MKLGKSLKTDEHMIWLSNEFKKKNNKKFQLMEK